MISLYIIYTNINIIKDNIVIKMSTDTKELKIIFEKSKMFSDKFSNLSKMLLSFPPSLIILRLAANGGRTKFSRTCKIFSWQIYEIENGTRGLGIKRVSRIVENIKNKNLQFKWSKIKSTFKIFNQIPKKGFFGKDVVKQLDINLGIQRKISICGLKSIAMNDLEFKVFNILKSNSIQFERQALLPNSLSTSRMIVIDFAIPNGNDAQIIIEATNTRFIPMRKGLLFTPTSLSKIILGFRIKKLDENIKTIIVVGNNNADDASLGLLKEAFDFVLTKDEIDKLPNTIKGILNADQN